MKKILLLAMCLLLLASCIPNPYLGKKLHVPSWLVGTWETNLGTKLEVKGNTIKLYSSGNIQNLSEIAKDLNMTASSSETRYELIGYKLGYTFEKIDGGIRLCIIKVGSSTYYDFY